jgi:hypothetical protein
MQTWRDTYICFGGDEPDMDLKLYEFKEIRNGFLIFKWANLMPWTSEYPEYVYVNKDKIKSIGFRKGD